MQKEKKKNSTGHSIQTLQVAVQCSTVKVNRLLEMDGKWGEGGGSTKFVLFCIWIHVVFQASVSLKRLQRFLDNEDLDTDAVIRDIHSGNSDMISL